MKSNASILFTWEIGQGLGHVLPFLDMAREFRALGHRVSFALRDVRGAGSMLQSEGFTVLQAPFHPDRFFPADGPQPQSMADVLAVFGFTSVQTLQGMRAAWEGLFLSVRPDLVIASYAPLSLLCARQNGIPTLLVATPFELPVNQHPLPAWRSGAAAHGLDPAVIDAVNKVFDRVQVASVYQVFGASKTYIMSFPELDFFAPRSQVEYCGTFFASDAGIEPRWPAAEVGDQPRVFAYFRVEQPQLDSIRQAVHSLKMRFCIVLRDATPAALETWSAPNVFITDQMLRLDYALADCDAVFNFSGAGMNSAALLAGKPVVTCLYQLEAALNAQQVAKLGAGLIVPSLSKEAITHALVRVTTEPQFAQAAQQFASRHRGYSPLQAAKHVALQALELLD